MYQKFRNCKPFLRPSWLHTPREELIFRPLFIKRALRWAGGPFLQFFLQIFNRKGHTHILTKIGEKNPVISGIGPFDN